MNLNLFALEASSSTTATTGDLLGSMLFPILMFAVVIVMFVVMGRKQKKQDKEIADMRNGLRVGDEVTTTGGIVGRIVQVKEETVVVETSRDGTKIRFLKSAIARVDVPVNAPAKEEPKGETLKEDPKSKKK